MVGCRSQGSVYHWYGMSRSVPCTKCFPVKPISGAEEGALKDLEKEYVALRKSLVPRKSPHPMSTRFDYGKLSNTHPIENKSLQFNQVYLRLVELRGRYICSFCSGTGRRTEKSQSPLPVIALDGGSECVATTERLQRCLEVVRRTTISAPSTQEKAAGFLRPTNTPVCPSAATADLLRRSGDLKKSRGGMTADILAEARNSDMHEDDLKGPLGWKGKEDQVTHPLTVSTTQDFIRSRMGIADGVKQYANVWVKSVYPVARIKPGRMTSGLKVVARIMEHTTGEDYVPPETFHLQRY